MATDLSSTELNSNCKVSILAEIRNFTISFLFKICIAYCVYTILSLSIYVTVVVRQ